jgi:hypothetical protein
MVVAAGRLRRAERAPKIREVAAHNPRRIVALKDCRGRLLQRGWCGRCHR